MICENLTTEGLDVQALKVGPRLSPGPVQLELSAVCRPCQREWNKSRGADARIVGTERGMLCQVLRGGTVSQGDPIVTGSPVGSDRASA